MSFVSLIGFVQADSQAAGINSKKYIAELEITEYLLANGMKIVLKPTKFETQEVLVRVIATGGYASLPMDKYAEGFIASKVALESGLNGFSSDQLSALLYKNSIELNLKVTPFSRLIEGSTDGDGIPAFFNIVRMIFMESQFTKEAFLRVVKETKDGLENKTCDREINFDELFNLVNTQYDPFFKPLTQENLSQADYLVAKNFFENSFSNPAEFVCIVVGDFDVDDILKVIPDTLAKIKKKTVNISLKQPTYPKFPKGIVVKEFTTSKLSDSLVRITFPLSLPLNEKQFQPFEVAMEVVESRMRDLFRSHFKSTLGISLSYEFPFYPFLYRPWLVIQYRSQPRQVDFVKDLLFKELKKIGEFGPTKEELEKVLSNMRRTDEFWLRENSFWITALSNYYIWGWDPLCAINSFKNIADLTPQDIKTIIQNYIPLNNYTLINFHN